MTVCQKTKVKRLKSKDFTNHKEYEEHLVETSGAFCIIGYWVERRG